MKPIIYSLLFCSLGFTTASAQFAPQANQAGSDAIHASDNRFRDWASGCTYNRGWLDIADKSLGQPHMGTDSSALGYPDANVLSLGDSGVAVVTFPYSVRNGAGPDFAVFENGFANPLDPFMAYLEFAFVEVSSDGTNFYRLPAVCNIQDSVQADNFTYLDARQIYNLAGKYVAGYGSPFDLEDMKGITGLNVDAVTHIRLVDVIGSIDTAHASFDKNNRRINDPYPSVYPSGGFDLNAVGVINSNKPTGISQLAIDVQLQVYPNPASEVLNMEVASTQALHYQLTDVGGRVITSGTFRHKTSLRTTQLAPGLYFLQIDNGRDKSILKVSKR